MPPDFRGKRGMECLNTRFPLPTLPCAGYSVNIRLDMNLKIIKVFLRIINNILYLLSGMKIILS